MYDMLKNKKLLVVGSTPVDVRIVNVAHEMGMYVIVVDGINDYSKAPAKLIADEAWDIDYSKIDEVIEKAKGRIIDGVIAGYSEFRVLAACRIANALNLPFYATEEQILVTRNKRLFKDMCIKYGVKTPKDYFLKSLIDDEQLYKIDYPVIVKPTDYGGRKGITVVNCPEKMHEAIKYALEKSESKSIVIEEYLNGIEFTAVYTLDNGIIKLSCVNEKYTTSDQERITGLCNFLIAPASFTKQYIGDADKLIQDFLRGIGARNGVAFFQGMYTERGVYVFEMGYRINGNDDFISIEKNNGVNCLKMLINYSVTGEMGDGIEKNNPIYKKITVALPINVHGGKISLIDYSNLLNRDDIFDINCFVKVGDVIPEDGSTNQKAMLIRYVGDTIADIKSEFEFILQNVFIKDENDKNMLFANFDFNVLENNYTYNCYGG